MKGQVSLEYLLIVGFLLFFTAVLTKYYSSFAGNTGASVVVDASLNNFKRVADSVYALGPPASQPVRISIPDHVEPSMTGFNGSVLQISFYDSRGGLVNAVRSFNYALSGFFPNSSGNYDLVITSLGAAGVRVS